MTTLATRNLSEAQVAAYRRDGSLAVPSLIPADRIAELRAATEAFVERSRDVRTSDATFDLDPRHSAEAPVLRRIKNPADNHPAYHRVAFESPIPDIVAELIGPDVKLAADSTGSPLVRTVVRGQPARRVRWEAGEMQAPPRLAGPYTSIYELQTAATADGMR